LAGLTHLTLPAAKNDRRVNFQRGDWPHVGKYHQLPQVVSDQQYFDLVESGHLCLISLWKVATKEAIQARLENGTFYGGQLSNPMEYVDASSRWCQSPFFQQSPKFEPWPAFMPSNHFYFTEDEKWWTSARHEVPMRSRMAHSETESVGFPWSPQDYAAITDRLWKGGIADSLIDVQHDARCAVLTRDCMVSFLDMKSQFYLACTRKYSWSLHESLHRVFARIQRRDIKLKRQRSH
jgi:hypothetical protein